MRSCLTPKAFAVIPARAGSERVPNKNFRDYKSGKNLTQLAAECALESQIFEEIFISSDSRVATQLADFYGLRFIPRSPEAASSTATATDVLLSLIKPFKSHGIDETDYVYYLQPTSPSRRAEDLKYSWEKIQQVFPKGVISLVPSMQSAYKDVSLTQSGEIVSMFGDALATSNSQSLPQTYRASGDFFCFRWGHFLKTQTFPISECIPYFVDPSCSVDIDTLDQFD